MKKSITLLLFILLGITLISAHPGKRGQFRHPRDDSSDSDSSDSDENYPAEFESKEKKPSRGNFLENNSAEETPDWEGEEKLSGPKELGHGRGFEKPRGGHGRPHGGPGRFHGRDEGGEDEGRRGHHGGPGFHKRSEGEYEERRGPGKFHGRGEEGEGEGRRGHHGGPRGHHGGPRHKYYRDRRFEDKENESFKEPRHEEKQDQPKVNNEQVENTLVNETVETIPEIRINDGGKTENIPKRMEDLIEKRV